MTGVDHHDHEAIVELARVPTRFEADVLVAALEARGVKASAVHSDAGAWAPNLSADVGHRVMVFEGDRETARALLDAEGLTEVADRDERDEPRGRVRGRVVLGASLRLWVSHPMFRLTTTARQPAAMADRPERQKVGGLMSVIEEANPRGKVGGSLRAAVLAAGQRWASGQRELVRLVRELDASGEWAADGEPSCAHWVAAALDIELCTAREWLRIGRALVEVDVIADAFEARRPSYSKVRALTRRNGRESGGVVRIGRARGRRATRSRGRRLVGSARDTGRDRGSPSRGPEFHVATRRGRDGGGIVPAVTPQRLRRSRRRSTPSSCSVGRPPTDVDASADASTTTKDARWPSIAQQRADALVAVVSGGGAAISTEIVMHVRADGCSLDDGSPIAGSVIERIAPHAFLRALIHNAERQPINASGKQRHPTDRQGRVVKARDRCCVDCGSTEFLQYDHEPGYDPTHDRRRASAALLGAPPPPAPRAARLLVMGASAERYRAG